MFHVPSLITKYVVAASVMVKSDQEQRWTDQVYETEPKI